MTRECLAGCLQNTHKNVGPKEKGEVEGGKEPRIRDYWEVHNAFEDMATGVTQTKIQIGIENLNRANRLFGVLRIS